MLENIINIIIIVVFMFNLLKIVNIKIPIAAGTTYH